jgi:hypothetical protein
VLAACSSAQVAPFDIADVRANLENAVSIVETGFNREDPILASQPVGSSFTMDGNVAVRYRDGGWNSGWVGIGKFREYCNGVFGVHANIIMEMTVTDVMMTGDLATAIVQVDFYSMRSDRTPPENHTASGIDYLVFERDTGSWLLRRWEEKPPPPVFEEPPVEEPQEDES